nr:PH domain-containing protein DDB_G0287875-like [Aedes albopictus]
MVFEHGQDHDCAVCNRPNNAELYMVQCGGCKRWHHFSCARVDAHTVKSKEFRCAECLPKQGFERSSRSVSGRSSATSGRSSQIDREIQRLEDERRVEEEVENERLRQEKLLIEKAAKEKLDREKQFIARKHELLKLKDDESVSITSRRSSRSSIRKVEDWVNMSLLLAAQRRKTSRCGSEVCTGEFQKGLAVGGPRTSLPRTIGSVTIGESPEKEFPKLDLVDVQQYARLLDDSEPSLSDRGTTSKQSTTGTKPRIVAKLTNPTPFEMWHRETCQLRRQRDQDMLKHGDDEKKRYDDRLHEIEAALQRQRDMELEHQQDNELRRRREVELVNQLNRLEDQHAEERKQLKEAERALRRQLEESHLRYQTLEAERKLQQAAQEEQLHKLREREQHLARQLESIRLQDKGGQPTEFQLHDAASSQPYNVAMCQHQSTSAMSGGQGIFVSNPQDMLS